MTQETFKVQIERLKVRFGERHFDGEFIRLAWQEVKEMETSRFVWNVNTWLGSRKPSQPPMLAEFKEAMSAYEKSIKKTTIERVAKNYQDRTDTCPLKSLEPYVGRVSSVTEAIEVRRLQIMREKDKNPNYDPLKDPKWKGEAK